MAPHAAYSLTIKRDQEIVQVNIAHVQGQRLSNAASGIEQDQHKQMQPPFMKRSWLPTYEPLDLSRGKCGQQSLWLFHLWNFQRRF
jgi:hypothetical protein